MADFAQLDALFECPAYNTDERLRDIYQVLLVSFQTEASRLPLSTAQMVRIALLLPAILRARQADAVGYGAEGFANAAAEKEFKTFIINGLNSVDEVLHKNRLDPRTVEWSTVQQALEMVLGTVPEAAERQRLVRQFADAFSRLGAA